MKICPLNTVEKILNITMEYWINSQNVNYFAILLFVQGRYFQFHNPNQTTDNRAWVSETIYIYKIFELYGQKLTSIPLN